MEQDFNRILSYSQIKFVKAELERRAQEIVELSYDKNIRMTKMDRQCIQSYIERKERGERPGTIPLLLKTFFGSCFGYSVVHKYISTFIFGEPNIRERLPFCLAKIFNEPAFNNETNWFPEKLYRISQKTQDREHLDLKSNDPKSRIMAGLLDGSIEMGKRLEKGLENFYQELEEINNQPGEVMWQFVEDFAKNIFNMGPNLVCDFVKDIGFDRFVKIDHHMKKEFPSFIDEETCKKLNDKKLFLLSQHIADLLQVTPYYLDHVLYQWGRFKKYIS